MHKHETAMAFLRFNRLTLTEKLSLIERIGILLDTEVEDNSIIELYFLQGFFVEKITHIGRTETELIPFKNGYRVYNFLN